ncbi:ABC transporter ATP-binding protein [Coralloluteibacterium thermophilus]|uniref:ABC transporter ATP-binding protein n=1 Tax=Coralloluteibacterium thermophilum TaxID=2707049 RepID=A0ABV9NM86_9GAMM
MTLSMLEIDRLQVGYPAPGGQRLVVDALSLSLAPGEIGALLGASGCGKTTVLRAVAGFEPAQAGRIVLGGRVLAETGTGLPPEARQVGMMFQDYALFPHLTVGGNVAFGLRGRPRAERRRRVAEMLELVGLADAMDAYPHELSGGQQQRAALARALAPEPRLLLLDEPFSNLDAGTREQLAGELRNLLKRTGTTVLMVTHDQAEAFAMADRIGVMDGGRILQWADARTLYQSPADRTVAAFVGRGSVLRGASVGMPGEEWVLLRPDTLVPDPAGPLQATVEGVVFRGPHWACTVRLESGEVLLVDLPDAAVPASGSVLRLRYAAEPQRGGTAATT